MEMQCVVTRAFGGPNGRVFQTGELVEASEWKHTQRLIAQRYLRPATVEEIANAEDVDAAYTPRPKARRGRRS